MIEKDHMRYETRQLAACLRVNRHETPEFPHSQIYACRIMYRCVKADPTHRVYWQQWIGILFLMYQCIGNRMYNVLK